MDIIHKLKNSAIYKSKILDLSKPSIDSACNFPTIGGCCGYIIYLCNTCFISEENERYSRYTISPLVGSNTCHNCAFNIACQLKNTIVSCINDILINSNTIAILNLKYSNISNDNVKNLCHILERCKSVKYLNLNSNSLTDDSAMYISQLLLVNNSLLKLNIGRNNIKISGINNIVSALKINNTLEQLNISGCYVGPQLCYAVVDMLKYNNTIHSLNIGSNFLTRTREYEDTHVDSNDAYNAFNTFRFVNNCNGIKYLLESLCENRSLKKLNLKFNDICDHDRDVAKHIKMLLRNNQTLTHLDLSFNMIRNYDMVHIGKGLEMNKSLKFLNLRHNGGINNEADGISYLSRALVKNTSLVSLNLNDGCVRRRMSSICQALTINNSIKALYLSASGINVGEMEMLYKSIEHNTSINILDLSSNFMDDECATYIVKLLTKNKYIRYLDIKHSSFTYHGIRNICECIEQQYTLNHLVYDDYATLINGLSVVAYKQRINQYIDRNNHNNTLKNKILYDYLVVGD